MQLIADFAKALSAALDQMMQAIRSMLGPAERHGATYHCLVCGEYFRLEADLIEHHGGGHDRQQVTGTFDSSQMVTLDAQSVSISFRNFEAQRRAMVRAENRADRLFRSLLTPRQKDQLRRYGAFGVVGNKGGRFLISIRDGTSRKQDHDYGLLFELTNENPWGDREIASEWITTWCIQPAYNEHGYLPPADRTLAWKLMCEGNEDVIRETGVPDHYVTKWHETYSDGGPLYSEHKKLRQMAVLLTDQIISDRHSVGA